MSRRRQNQNAGTIGCLGVIVTFMVAGALAKSLGPGGAIVGLVIGLIVAAALISALTGTTRSSIKSRAPERSAPPRPAIPPAVKNAVFIRDQGTCQRCGSRQNLEIDHVIPLSRGGSNTEKNLQVLCATCNRRKGNRYVG